MVLAPDKKAQAAWESQRRKGPEPSESATDEAASSELLPGELAPAEPRSAAPAVAPVLDAAEPVEANGAGPTSTPEPTTAD